GAEFPRLRNRVEDPQTLAGSHIECTNVALLVLAAPWHATLGVSGANDDHVLDHERSGVETDLAGDRIHFLVVVLLQIEDAVGAEAGGAVARLGVKRNELIPGC